MASMFFPSFLDNPDSVSFSSQESNERIDLFLRQHWFVNVSWILTSLVLILIPFLIFPFNQITGGFGIDLSFRIELVLWTVWYLVVLAYIIERFLYWYFNIYIVTNLNVIDISFNSLLSQSTIEIDVADVESAKASYQGIIGPFFNFGDVEIETAAKDQAAKFYSVPQPTVVADRVQSMRERKIDGGE